MAGEVIQLTEFSSAHVDQLHALYQNEWWSHDRTVEQTQKAIAGSSLNFGFVNRDTDELVAYTRVLSDFVLKAIISDVIVRPDFRNHGLGARLMEAVLSHPALAEVKRFELSCLPEMEPFYARWGFTADLSATRRLLKAFSPKPIPAESLSG